MSKKFNIIIIKVLCLVLITTTLISLNLLTTSYAATITSEPCSAYVIIPNNTSFYLKNANSGQYLDLAYGTDSNGTNIHQWKYKGSKNQQWKFVRVGSVSDGGLYKIVSVNSSSSRVVDINHGGSSNNTNVSLYSYNGGSNQQFALSRTSTGAYKILSKCSNYKSALTVKSASCSQGGNVIQYQYNGSHNDEWFLEPVNKSSSYGVGYADRNYNRFPSTYPDVNGLGGDCANFVSQCMAASGIHYTSKWYIYKKNNSYLAPSNTNQLDNSWGLSSPSPWISAKYFNKYWSDCSYTVTYSAKDLLNKPSIPSRIGIGDVVQYSSNSSWGFEGEHTMYITGYDLSNNSFLVSYHTSNTKDKKLYEICKNNSNKTFRFFDVI